MPGLLTRPDGSGEIVSLFWIVVAALIIILCIYVMHLEMREANPW